MNPWTLDTGVVEYPDGRRIRGRGLRQRLDGSEPEFGVYLLTCDPGPFAWEHVWISWPDFRRPRSTELAIRTLTDVYLRSSEQRVEIACGGGIGRTGTALSAIAVMAGIPRDDAIGWVRERYHPRAVETRWQRAWVRNSVPSNGLRS